MRVFDDCEALFASLKSEFEAVSRELQGIIDGMIYNLQPGRGGMTCLIFNPVQARALAREGWSKQRIKEFVERFRYKATKAKQAQSRLKQIERLKEAQVETRAARRTLGFEFINPRRSGRVVIEAQRLRLDHHPEIGRAHV